MTMLPSGEVAPIKRRVMAYVIDVLIAAILPVIGAVIVIASTVSALQSQDPTGALLALAVVMPLFGLLTTAWAIVYTLMQAGRGSIGMRTQKLRLVSAETGAPIGFWRALLRNIVFGVTAAVVIGCFSPLFDGSGRFQGWHDKAGGALMVADRTGSGSAAAAERSESAADALPLPPVPPLPLRPSLPSFEAPAPAAAQPSLDETVAAAPPAPAVAAPVASPALRGLPDDPLISFVPGVTQPPVSAAQPAPAVQPAPTVDPSPPTPQVSPVPPLPASVEPPAPAPAAPVAPAAPEPPAPAPAAPERVDNDDDIESTRISIPGHRLIFTWDDGQRAEVSRRVLFGRNPDPEAGATVFAVRDETLSLSKTHFEAGSEASGGWVMDRQSTNGTVIVRDGARIDCPPGQRVPVRLGDALEIGDRIVTIGGYA